MFDPGRHKGKAADCHPAQHRNQPPHPRFLQRTLEPFVHCFSEHLGRNSSQCVTSVRAQASPSPAAQAFYPLEGSARELPQFAFPAAGSVAMGVRSTQMPYGQVTGQPTPLPIPALFMRDGAGSIWGPPVKGQNTAVKT